MFDSTGYKFLEFKYACSLYVLDIFVSGLKSLSFNYAMKKKCVLSIKWKTLININIFQHKRISKI